MQRVLAILSYDGTNFHGYQRQPVSRSVQGEIEKALRIIHKAEFWPSTSSGRTDAGVHGLNQPVHFDTPLSIPEDRWAVALNSILPNDMHVQSCQYVPSTFHARYDAVGKEYVYRMSTAVQPDVFKRNYVYHLPKNLDLTAMSEAAEYLLGTHNFTSLSSPKTDVVDKVRTIFRVNITRYENEWTFRFIGSGFLYQMVRILMGTIIQAGIGDINSSDISRIIVGMDRTLAGPTAPGCGLYLAQVFYERDHLEKYLAEL
ncbi:tRNA pseudouridine(38-40) synthase TruA [Salipaludibacillus sp. CF4.18]|uniref:tRNA pseudouridine(38-40) synthase TruA n=1 Tax=Salipaludibacillus sp. CF4.18 TaxID=3373081 RepID=UPI003EE5AD37